MLLPIRQYFQQLNFGDNFGDISQNVPQLGDHLAPFGVSRDILEKQ